MNEWQAEVRRSKELLLKPSGDCIRVLGTGDVLIKSGDTETLLMSSGDNLIVHRSGSYELMAVSGAEVHRSGTAIKILFGDNDSVEISRYGIDRVQRQGNYLLDQPAYVGGA